MQRQIGSTVSKLRAYSSPADPLVQMPAGGGGGLISQQPAAYSGDGKFVICPCGHNLNVYSAVTSDKVGHLRGHTADVTAVVLNPHDKSQVGIPSAHTCSFSCRTSSELSHQKLGLLYL